MRVDFAGVYLERSINHFVTASREVLAGRLGITPVRHRLGKPLGEFGRKTIARLVGDLGPLPVGKPARRLP